MEIDVKDEDGDGAGTVSWRQLLAEAKRLLGDEREARWLCEDVSGCSGAEWIDILDEPVGQRAVARFDALVARRVAGEPLAYVLGHWSFRTLDLMVDARVLIPRPETEIVAEVALAHISTRRGVSTPVVVADLGTGSGAIALSIAAENPIGAVEVWASDVSPDAVNVARANLAGISTRLAAHVRISEGSWFDALPDELMGRIDVLVSNPPYIAIDDPEVEASVHQWEPASALFGGNDGLDAYRVLAVEAPHWLSSDGVLVAEIGHRQRDGVLGLFDQASGWAEAEVSTDLAGRDRVMTARVRPSR
ncbi:MAG: peptide chain release factor N(5)-glutamine methyltransferase [Acidimicrobiia bacterium]